MKSNVKLTQNNHYVLRKVKTDDDDALDDCSLRTNQAADNKIDQWKNSFILTKLKGYKQVEKPTLGSRISGILALSLHAKLLGLS